MSNIKTKVISSLEKCFFDDSIEDKKEKKDFVMFKNERLSFQVAYCNTEIELRKKAEVLFSGDLASCASVREVVNVPSMYPLTPLMKDDPHLLRREPGMYPDMIRPLRYHGKINIPSDQLNSFWVDISLPDDMPAGEYGLCISLKGEDGNILSEEKVSVCVVDAELPEQRLIHTEWFYTDCLAEYYHVKAFSEKHWKTIESFVRTAVNNGINMILTPVFTPELDTYVGGERLTTQLVDITVEKDGSYTFGFDKLERWIDMCVNAGVKYFEIPHFFTQWGSDHAPKFVARVNGRLKRIFGWETDALGNEYRSFLGKFIPAMIDVFKKKGVDQGLFFHVSDEPHMEHLEQYTRCREILSPLVEGHNIIDALSDYEFYESGALKKPVPGIKSIKPFIENNVEGLWAYYCGQGSIETTNRLFAHALARTRILGVQLYLYNIEGFLHWGYNFYKNRHSYDIVDPFGNSDGDFFVPSGDTYLVYPGTDGEAWESIRLNALREAVDDMRALDLCEKLYGREFTEKLIVEDAGELTFWKYPLEGEYLISLREKVARAIAEKA